MKDSELLKQVKNMIASGSEVYICVAILRSSGSPSQKSNLKEWIRVMLNGHYTLESWMRFNLKNHNTIARNMSDEEYDEKLKVTRLAWLDWMIKQCQKAEAIK